MTASKPCNLMRRLSQFLLTFSLIGMLLACSPSEEVSQSRLPKFQTTEISGKTISQTDLVGKVSIVNFWATSCTTCVKEMPEMIKVFKELQPEGLQFLAIAMSYDPPMYVMNYAKTRELPFIVAMDSDGTTAKAFGKVELTPTTFVISKTGKVLKRYVGEPNWNEFRAVLKEALAANAT